METFYFNQLTQKGSVQGDDYESIPRGFTVWDSEQNIYMIVGGEYLTQESAAFICKEFGFNPNKGSWAYVQSPIYTYKNIP